MTQEYSKIFGSTKITLKQGDITKETSDAIVNAANSALMDGGGVCGAIHRAGGPRILEESQRIVYEKRVKGLFPGCTVGDAVITTGGNLPAKYVIHTVGPQGSDIDRADLLKNAYVNSLNIAVENALKTISFPSISTGIFGYPIQEAAQVALQIVRDFAKSNPGLSEVNFILFTREDYMVYENVLRSL